MRVLLLSLYYPPLNTIAAQRVKSFEKYLSGQQIDVDVLTRYYDPEQQKGKSMLLGSETPASFDQDYIREGNTVYTNFRKENSKESFSSKLPPVVKGMYNYFNVDVFHYSWISYAEEAFKKEFSRNKYDFIIASYGPPVVMLLAKRLSDAYSIPFLIDFRDSYIDERDVSYHLVMKRFVLKRTLKGAAGLIFATGGMKEYFFSKAPASVKNLPPCIVYNGVEESAPGKLQVKDNDDFGKIKETHDLVLLHTGTLYEGQNISFFIDAVKAHNERTGQNVAIVFLGLAENKMKELPKERFIYFLPKVDLGTSLGLQREASALLLPVWDGRYTGFSGKTQEYLFSGNYILTSPGPQNDLRSFLDLSPNVFICDNHQMLSGTLEKIIKGEIERKPLLQKEKLFRSYWIRELALFLAGLKKK